MAGAAAGGAAAADGLSGRLGALSLDQGSQGSGGAERRGAPRVAGLDAPLAALRELVGWPVTYADEAAALGVTWPRGLLLHGPPGCGKTLLVRQVAGGWVHIYLMLYSRLASFHLMFKQEMIWGWACGMVGGRKRAALGSWGGG
jgi:hypothetical protein